jgi:hypothetical protein
VVKALVLTAGLYAGLANSPRLQTGFEKIFSGLHNEQKYWGALPQSANPYGNPMSARL